MNLRCKYYLFILLILGTISSCTVFENRDKCPCYLSVDLSQMGRDLKDGQIWFFNQLGELVLKDTIHRNMYNSPYVLKVPRYDSLTCFVWCNLRHASKLHEEYSLKSFFTKVDGLSADSLFFYTGKINTNNEDSYFKINPNKEFATIDIVLQGIVSNDYKIEVKVNCINNGFYINKDFKFSNSQTIAQLNNEGDNFTTYRCRILRQIDQEDISLDISIWDINQPQTKVPLINSKIPIGQYLEENGYDMTLPSMADITIYVDYSYNVCIVKVDNWQKEYSLLVEI